MCRIETVFLQKDMHPCRTNSCYIRKKIRMQSEPVTGIILAGGKSSRFGTNKAMFHYKGKPMVELAIEVLRPICSDLLISTNQPDHYSFTRLMCVPDTYPDCGPLGGIHACLLQSDNIHNLIIACDLPELEPRLYQVLLQHRSGYQVVIPVHHGIKEPTASYFNKNTAPVIQEALIQKHLKLRDVLDTLHTCYLDVGKMAFYSDHLFANVNTLKDLDDLTRNR